MITFPYVEDYIEVINGDRNPVDGKLYGLFNSTQPIISLARYDVNIVASISDSTSNGKSLTDKQAELVCKLILKYQKQLEKLNIDVKPVENPQFRMPIRVIDRRRIVELTDDAILLKFPYDTKLIDNVRELAKLSQGSWIFDSKLKVWNVGLTEPNVVAVDGFAKNNQFEVDEKFNDLVHLVLNAETQPYEIKLVSTDSGYTVTNAAPSLLEAINSIDTNNIDLLVDNAPIFGYTVDQAIEQHIISKYSPRVYNLMTAQETKFNPTVPYEVVKDIVEYAQVANRFPIYIYEPDMSDRLLNNFVNQYFEQDEIYRVRELKKQESAVNKKVIYFNKFHASWDQPISLLVSGQGMMHGGEKQMLLQLAEKVVYFVAEVYNSKNLRRT